MEVNVRKKYREYTMDMRIVIALIVVAIGVVLFLYTRESYTVKYIDTPPEVEYIENEPDKYITYDSGMEIIPPGDIAQSPGFGVGAGTFGFGRYGASMMV